jgi:hypothetical protein
VADHAVDLGIDQLLRHGRALFRIGAVIFRHQHPFHCFAVDLGAFGVQVVDRHFGRVLVVLAQVGGGARHGAHMADLDHFLRAGAACEREGDGEWNELSLEQHKHSPMNRSRRRPGEAGRKFCTRPEGTTNYLVSKG